MSSLQTCYNKIIAILHQFEPDDYFLNQRRLPKLTDKQLIALSLSAESLGIDSERYLFKQLPEELAPKIERSVYNRRRRQLNFKVEQLRQILADKLAEGSLYIVDSMPLETCKMSRARRSRVCKEEEYCSPDYGYCAAQRMHYYGYKIHAVCTRQGVFKAFDISKASVHDIHYLHDIKQHLNHCVLVGDKGYLSQAYQQDLFENNNIELRTPMRSNQLLFKPFSNALRKSRKRIETLFSQLCDQFMIRRNYAKSFSGFSSRILAKITALTIIQWINFTNGNNINNLKGVIS